MKKIIITSVVALLSTVGFSQTKTINKGNKEYNKYAYFEAKDIYEKVANKGHKSVDLFEKLGDSYYFNADLPTANKWYTELFAMGEAVDPEYMYRYAQTLKATGDLKKYDEYLKKFAQAKPTDTRGTKFLTEKDYLDIIKANSGRHQIENAGINSNVLDFGAAFYKNQLVFTSARDTTGGNIHNWTNQGFTKIMSSEINGDGSLTEPVRFSKSISTKVNESTPVFTKDGNTMYFTRNNYNKGKKGKDENGTILLKIYKATNNNGVWENITEVPFNSNDYSVAHPALNAEETHLYFSSNMPGGKGASDLYKVAINGDGSFGTPENLGDVINTEARETFPFISENNELYFASDGHLGLGGLDVFGSKISENGITKPVNIGSPINSAMDDFGYIISNSKIGFFTSNRAGGQGSDDIYKFKENIKLELDNIEAVTGIIIDEETNEIIPNTEVTIYNDKMEEVAKVMTDKDGKYSFDKLAPNTNYTMRAKGVDGEMAERVFKTGNSGKPAEANILTKVKVKKVKVGDDLAKAFKIEIIYFDLDKSFIRKDAAVDLAKVVEVMKQNPTMKVDIRSHTDCRQTADYNAKLSERRAQATMAWMVKQGIAKDRLTAKGYGESQLVNDCGCEPTNQSNCTEEQHQQNRRSEFIITAL
jgi:outer membrane protein OmpA-like peptidoglycan-associated protein/tetratricopeptide (TPR) repeat protein